MGTDFDLACGDCLEFIDLHKWSIVDYDPLSSRRIIELFNQLLVPVTAKQLTQALDNFVPPQPYIEKLLPFVDSFITSHQNHFIFLTCDTGERPWDFGEPRYLEWKEIKTIWMYMGQFLPRNLIEDYGFRRWEEVLEYYSKHESLLLYEQMNEEREALKQAFEKQVSIAQIK